MCIAAVAIEAHPNWRLVAIANRDEFHARLADPLARWPGASGIIAGRDASGGGTWLGVAETGRFAVVTNYRTEGPLRPDAPSRGKLVLDLLRGVDPEEQALRDLNPFNLLLVDSKGARFVTNQPAPQVARLAPGVHGLSNGALDPPWRKTSHAMSALSLWLDQPGGSEDLAPLFAALRDPELLAGEWLDGGPEPRLSSVFVSGPEYGTRCSTVVAVDRAGRGRIAERRFKADGTVSGETEIGFHWSN